MRKIPLNSISINLIFFIVLLLFFNGCKKGNDVFFNTLNELEGSIPEDVRRLLLQNDENVSMAEIHFGYALKFRNDYLMDEKGEKLKKFFHDKGVHHVDEMSDIVFRSLHRRLNSRTIELDKQINAIVEYWILFNECEKERAKRISDCNRQFAIGDTITVKMPVDKDFNTTLEMLCPNISWCFEEDRDLLIAGVIIQNNKSESKSDFFKIKIITMSSDEILILSEDVDIGDEIYISLGTSIIEKYPVRP